MHRPSWLRRKKRDASHIDTTQASISASGTVAVPSGADSNPGPNTRKSLWDQAYDQLRKEKADLVTSFEKILLSEPEISQTGIGDGDGQRREKQLSALVDRKLAIMNEKQWRFEVGGKDIKVREQVDRIVKVVLVAKDIVSAAASLDPLHAGIPWAGVCVLLPLIVNDSEQRNAATDGLEYVTTLVRRYGEIERIYLQDSTTLAPNNTLGIEVTKLYKKILEYQAKAACQYNRNTTLQIARNIVQLDSWQGNLKEIMFSEASCDKIIGTIDSKDQRGSMKRLEDALKEQIFRVSEMLRASREQDLEQEKLLLGELKGGREDQNEWHRNSDEAKCYACLRTTNYELNKNKNPDRIPGTCEWFLRHPRYQKWLKNSESNWLWVTADPGCGKSVLSKHLVKKYESTMEPGTLVCYYFFKDDSAESRSATHALCAILHQLLSQRRCLMDHALLEYQRNGEKVSTLFDTLWEVFCAAVADHRCGRVVCVLDALDECEMSTRLLLVQTLAGYYTQPDGKASVKFIVTSRPNTMIGDAFWLHGQDPASIQLMGENPEEMEAITFEVNLVIRERIKQFDGLRQRRGVYDDASVIVQEHLDGIENRTYLWVSLIFPELEKNAGSPRSILLKLIKTLPATVDEAYERILQQSRNFSLARKLLHIVVAAVRPLTLSEMNIALSVTEGEAIPDASELEAEPSFRITVRELCGLFVNIRDERIFLIHQTAKEFLVDESEIPDDTACVVEQPGWKKSLEPVESDSVLANICMSYLLMGCFEEDPLITDPGWSEWKLHQKVVEYTAKHEFLDYSAKNWSTHAKYMDMPVFYKRMLEAASMLINTRSPRFLTWFQLYWVRLRSENPYIEYRCPQRYNDLTAAAHIGNHPLVEHLWKNAENNLENRERELWVPLWCATLEGHSMVVLYLLQKVSDELTHCMGMWRALHAVVLTKSRPSTLALLELLLNRVGDLATLVDPIAETEGGWTLLHRAAYNGNEKMVSILLKNGADIAAKSSEGATALDAAWRDPSVVLLLISQGAAFTDAVDWKLTPSIILSPKSSDHKPLKGQKSGGLPSIGNSVVFNEETIKQLIDLDEDGGTLEEINLAIRDLQEFSWRMSDGYISRDFGSEMTNACSYVRDRPVVIGFRQLSKIGNKLFQYAYHRIEGENYTERDVEGEPDNWVDYNEFVYEQDDEVCLDKFWTGLCEFRKQLSESKKLLQEYYDLIS